MLHLSQRRRVYNWERMTVIFQRGYCKQPALDALEAAGSEFIFLIACCGYGRNLSVCSALCKSVLGQQRKSGGCQTENRSSFLVR